MKNCFIIILALAFLGSCENASDSHDAIGPGPLEGANPKNVVFILSDDHRYDFMGFTGKVPFLETPNMDKMAKEGVHMRNAFVTTSLCSPSRASILTGLLSHRHAVIDNQSLVNDSLTFFPQYLQRAGYETGYIGKWHMGEHNANPRRGFDYWASFRGQGPYFDPTMNVNGEEVVHSDSSYITDVLTSYAMDFFEQRPKDKPFFLYLSHKAVHSEFAPAPRHKGKYANQPPAYPPTMFPPGQGGDPNYNYQDVPEWVKRQRYSWHGVDYMYHGQIKFDEFYQSYCEALLALDESIGSVLNYLEENDLMDNTVVFYMGDNGFSFGEHGLIDKRQAYEESMRVPLLVYGSQPAGPGTQIDGLVQNIDIAPTILEIAGLQKPAHMDGNSFIPVLAGNTNGWRDRVYYEYYWERPFPQTPTVHAVRTDKYKFIRYHGIWDINELFDLENDPWEMNNLIRSPQHQEIAQQLNEDIYNWLEETQGLKMHLKKDHGTKIDHKYRRTY